MTQSNYTVGLLRCQSMFTRLLLQTDLSVFLKTLIRHKFVANINTDIQTGKQINKYYFFDTNLKHTYL